jgi:hypothetical protein
MSLDVLTGIAFVALVAMLLVAIGMVRNERRNAGPRQSDYPAVLKEALDRARSRQLLLEPDRLGPARPTSSRALGPGSASPGRQNKAEHDPSLHPRHRHRR